MINIICSHLPDEEYGQHSECADQPDTQDDLHHPGLGHERAGTQWVAHRVKPTIYIEKLFLLFFINHNFIAESMSKLHKLHVMVL